MGLECMAIHIDEGFFIDAHEMAQPTAVIVMPMGQYRKIYFPQINTKHPGILRKQGRLSCIKKDLILPSFNVQA
jgi:hypothetical protein